MASLFGDMLEVVFYNYMNNNDINRLKLQTIPYQEFSLKRAGVNWCLSKSL